MKTGIQMYAIRSLCEEDLEAGLRTVSEIGYDGVEFAGFFGHTAEEVAGWLKKYNLEVEGAHVPHSEVFDQTDETIAFHKAIGNSRIIVPAYPLETRKDVEVLAAKFNAVAEQYHQNGMKLFYHNHAGEFLKKDNGECFIDILASLTDKSVLSLEFDVYWVYRGQEDPLKYLNQYSDRVEIFHAKDGTMENGTTAGTGNVPLPEVCELAKKLGMSWAVVESEASHERHEQINAAKLDFEYVSKLVK